LGVTTVTVTARDGASNTTAKSFTVTVRDTTAPVLTVPADVVAEATSAAGAIVTYAAATATDAVGPVTIAYSKASGTTFALGVAEATSPAGAVVSYAAATATDAVGPVTVAYSKGSGTTFALGTTTVTVTATDGASNTTAKSFTVTVRDTTAPLLTVPADQIAE